MLTSIPRLDPPRRRLMGPGPCPVHPRVAAAMTAPLLGHLDPAFTAIMDRVQDMLRMVFRTQNRLTLPISGTGTAGMEACLVNLIEPGDEVLCCVAGVFGARMADIAGRCGGVVHRLDRPYGQSFPLEEIADALARHPATKVVTVVHAETSTGAFQPIEELGALCRRHDAVLVVDAVTSLSGMPLEVDAWGIDACYSGTQKCLAGPPGLAPVTFGERAVAKLHARKTKVQSWYYDLGLIESYWQEGASRRTYHHTAPIANCYGLYESLVLALEEGLEARFERHRRNGRTLHAGMEAIGWTPNAKPENRLPMVGAFRVPEGLDELRLRRMLLDQHNIEIGGGLGELAGKIWRVGVMGEASRYEAIVAFLAATEQILFQEGWLKRVGAALEAAAVANAEPATAAAPALA